MLELYERVLALSHHKYRTWSVPHDSFGGTAHEDVLETGVAVSLMTIRSALKSRATFVMTSNAIPTWTITSFKSSGSIIFFANASSSFFMGPIGNPSPMGA